MTQTQIDEVSRAIGRMEGNMAIVLRRTKNIEKHVKEINGRVKNNEVRIDEIERHKWTLKKTSLAVGLVTTLLTMAGTAIAFTVFIPK